MAINPEICDHIQWANLQKTCSIKIIGKAWLGRIQLRMAEFHLAASFSGFRYMLTHCHTVTLAEYSAVNVISIACLFLSYFDK